MDARKIRLDSLVWSKGEMTHMLTVTATRDSLQEETQIKIEGMISYGDQALIKSSLNHMPLSCNFTPDFFLCGEIFSISWKRTQEGVEQASLNIKQSHPKNWKYTRFCSFRVFQGNLSTSAVLCFLEHN